MIAPPFVGHDKELPFVGRDEELEFLDRLTTAPLPSITFVNGIGWIGKSRVLDAFARLQITLQRSRDASNRN